LISACYNSYDMRPAVKNFIGNLKESAVSILPIAAIILVFGIFVAELDWNLILKFIVGVALLILGMSLFSIGADMAMIPLGEKVGSLMTKTRKLPLIIGLSFFIGVIITAAEPDLMVLAIQLGAAVNRYVFIITVSAGVGVFLILAILRIIFQINIRILYLISYVIIFVLGIFVPKSFLPLAFDSGGVTTGPMSVPFIIALCAGVAATESNSLEDSFGLVGLASAGPVIAVLILGLFIPSSNIDSSTFVGNAAAGDPNIALHFLKALPENLEDVAIALSPIALFAIAFNFIWAKLSKRSFVKILIGFLYVFVGITIFFTGVNAGFTSVGRLLGEKFVEKGLTWWLVPVGVLIGFFIVIAEPPVHVLAEQIEEISGGVIKKKGIFLSLMSGVAVSIGLALFRAIAGISIWWFIAPVYSAALILMFFSPKAFTSIAFDSGGVASGTMTVAFLLPLALGATEALGGNPLEDAFGMVAMVAMTPPVTIQLLGIFTKVRAIRATRLSKTHFSESVIEFDHPSFSLASNSKIDAVIDFDAEEPPAKAAGRTRAAIKNIGKTANKAVKAGNSNKKPKEVK